MPLLPFNFGKKKQQPQKVVEKEQNVREIIQSELQTYIKQNQLEGYLRKIESDKRKKEIWDGLSNHKKLQFLRYLESKRGGSQHEK